jgi:hypothetical protein
MECTMSGTIRVTFWKNVYATTTGQAQELSFDDLERIFRQPAGHFEGEKIHPGWSPAEFTADTRKRENVVRAFCLGLDFDKGISLAEVRANWTNTRGFLHTTRNHAPNAPRSRLIIELSRPVSANEYELLWDWASRAMATVAGGEVDPKAKDASRFWYLPGTTDGSPHDCLSIGGAPLDVDAVLAEMEEAGADASVHAAQSEADWGAVAPAPGTLGRAQAYLAKLPGAVSGSGGHQALWRATLCVVRGFCIPAEEAKRLLLAEYNPRCVPPWSDRELEHKVEDATTKAKLAWGYLLRGTDPAETRPLITVTNELHSVVDEAIRCLSSDPNVFQRNGKLVRVTHSQRSSGRMPLIQEISKHTLRETLTRCARWVKPSGPPGTQTSTSPSDQVVQTVLDRHEWSEVRSLTSVVETPTMRPDGSIVQHRGYDLATGFYYEPSIRFDTVADRPCPSDVEGACCALFQVWKEFPFACARDRSVAIAALLTLLARPAIRGNVPAFIFDANTRGAGKTLVVDAVSMIATGRAAPKVNYPVDKAELEKRLAAFAMQGTALIAFDNVTEPFGAGPLDAVLTCAGEVSFRKLGHNEAPTYPWQATITATGNNIDIVGDTARRVLVSRMVSKLERPEERAGFAHPDLLDWVREKRAELVAAGLTVLRGFHVAGRPQPDTRTWGAFEPWTRLVRAALMHAGEPDILAAKVPGASQPQATAHALLLRGITTAFPRGATARDILDTVFGAAGTQGAQCVTQLREAIDALVPTAKGGAPSSASLGTVLRGLKERNVGGLKLVSQDGRGGICRWRVEPL